MKALLELDKISAGYGDAAVLREIALKVYPGEIICLVGPNGAGKTTTMRVMMGLIATWGGSIIFNDRKIEQLAPYKRVNSGLALVPEGNLVVPDMSVEENLVLGAFPKRARRHCDKTLTMVYALFPRLAERKGQRAGLMSGGERQMVALGRALMSLPTVLLLDEPSLGLAPKLASEVFRKIREINSTGLTIFLVEQNIKSALAIASRGYMISTGRITFSGSSRELRDRIQRSYI